MKNVLRQNENYHKSTLENRCCAIHKGGIFCILIALSVGKITGSRQLAAAATSVIVCADTASAAAEQEKQDNPEATVIAASAAAVTSE
jgi:hypothetical protein